MSMTVAIRWAAGGLLVAAFAVALTALSPTFGYEYELSEMPILWLVGILVLAGLIFCLSCRSLSRTRSSMVRRRRA
jgi:hypothetical protein